MGNPGLSDGPLDAHAEAAAAPANPKESSLSNFLWPDFRYNARGMGDLSRSVLAVTKGEGKRLQYA